MNRMRRANLRKCVKKEIYYESFAGRWAGGSRKPVQPYKFYEQPNTRLWNIKILQLIKMTIYGGDGNR
jgi:hypothetical protein